MAKKKKTTYTKEFKMEAVRRSDEEGVTVAMVARELGIAQKLINNWRAAFKTDGHEAFPGTGHQTSEKAEWKALRDELRRVKMERDILKKALRVFAKE